jgi:uncharacterized protein YbdZ (MbtH family)
VKVNTVTKNVQWTTSNFTCNPCVAPPQPGTITGSSGVCPQTNITYTITAVSGANSYDWEVPSGWSIIGSSTGTSISVNTGNTSQNGNVRVRSYKSCGEYSNGSNKAVTVSVGIPTAAVAEQESGRTCTSFTANWNSSSNATSYQLDVSTVSNFSSFLSGFNNLNVGNVDNKQISGLTPGSTYYYRIRAVNSCGASTSSAVITSTVDPLPSIPVAQSGTHVTCTSFQANWNSAAEAVDYRLDVSSVSNFSSFVTGFNNLDVGNVTSHQVSGLTAGVTYYYRVRSVNPCGTSNSSVIITRATSPAAPAQPGAITGNATQCAGVTGQTYSVASVSGATAYTWSVPAGWSITAGQGTATLTVTSGSSGQNGNISVTASNSCGTSGASTKAVAVSLAPATPGAISGTTAQCPSASSQTYSISSVSNATVYNWLVPAGWSITGGQGTTTITVTAGSGGDNGNITVTAGNCSGNSTTSVLPVTATNITGGTISW